MNNLNAPAQSPPRGYTIPLIDLAGEIARDTVLLEDRRTMPIMYPKGHGRRSHLVRAAPGAGELGHVARDADHPPRH